MTEVGQGLCRDLGMMNTLESLELLAPGVGTKGGNEVIVRTDLDLGTAEVVVGSLASCRVRGH